ncbi:DUF397 domain-containing protein [Streptomyces bobili]|uniref:DUF397 domain-containing protein n=1 Tax=Streptomyces bobili TaxID=67280 RepID=UPI00344248DD
MGWWRPRRDAGAVRGRQLRRGGPGFTGVVPVRDSKVPHGPVLAFEFGSWAAFIGELKAGSRRG